MKKATEVVKTAAKAAAKTTTSEASPAYIHFPEFDGTTMKILNPPEHIRSMKPIGSKGFLEASNIFFNFCQKSQSQHQSSGRSCKAQPQNGSSTRSVGN